MMRFPRLPVCLAALFLACGAAAQSAAASTYTNPLPLRLADGSLAESCADPALLRDRTSSPTVWYLYCTMDPVSRKERDGAGWKFRMMPVYRSVDLVNWHFVRDSFDRRPAGLAGPKAGLWAPEPVYQNGSYYLYFTVTDVADRHSPEKGCEADSGIAVATSASPAGPWKAVERPVVAPRRAGAGCNFQWTFDPDVVEDGQGDRWLYYGSYGGGIFVQRLSKDGLQVEGNAVRVGAANRYEGAEVVRVGKYWYMFASTTDCCRGPLTGYALMVGRATSPEGPFLDREGNDMAAARAGGTPVLPQNGNRWVGAGHNSVFQDAAGQWWTLYHAVDRNQGYFSVEDKLTRRPLLLDRVDWVDGWPVINRGDGPSDRPMQGPAVTPGPLPAALPAAPTPVATTPLWSERFDKAQLDARWSWIRPRAAGSWSSGQPGLRLSTQPTDLHVDTNSAAVLATPLPEGDLRILARIRLDAPLDCCEKPVQAGIVVMRDDDNYVKLVELAHEGLRQVEFGKELAPVAKGYPRYGNTVAGTPGEWTWLRIDIRRVGDEEHYTAWSQAEGKTKGAWVGGTTWTHRLGGKARLGLVAMGGAGHAVTIDEVRIERLPR
ncbi:family 43 glycosylhydrolase [Massilia sp. IC2-477]|uniref:family 43 glycosylhydrolase n=1 Tax=Massilia sp. IC2-477 TaxID=2887198 RepID=UPI001D11680D|nr:family 43 glycosylhydrolase [Massilia sp. IC2-477]MCC2957478.1 family 43 glycosylhydrolase [Massilia sp. IC2-477]